MRSLLVYFTLFAVADLFLRGTAFFLAAVSFFFSSSVSNFCRSVFLEVFKGLLEGTSDMAFFLKGPGDSSS